MNETIEPKISAKPGRRLIRLVVILGVALGMFANRAALASHCPGDTLIGGGGDDEISGSNCDDVIVGNDGDNDLTGNRGHDHFIFSSGYCPPDGFCSVPPIKFWPTFGTSTINDFTHTFDLIGLDRATFQALSSSAGGGFSDPSDFAEVADETAIGDVGARIVFHTESSTLFYNENGAAPGLGEGGPFAVLIDVTTLEAADFEVVDWTPAPTTSTVTSTTLTTTTVSTTTTTKPPSTPSTSTTTTLPVCASAACELYRATHAGSCEGSVLTSRLQRRVDALAIVADRAPGSKKSSQKTQCRQTKTMARKLKTAADRSTTKPNGLSVPCGNTIGQSALRVVQSVCGAR